MPTASVVVPERAAAAAPEGRAVPERGRATAAGLAARLIAAGDARAPVSETHAELARLAPHLDWAEVAVLAHALERGLDVRIAYRNRQGNGSVRDIRPEQLYGRSLIAWCHLRSAEREFAMSGIESVGPVG